MANHDIRLSATRLTEVIKECGHQAACSYGYLVSNTFVEIQDPSDPSRRLGVVKVGDKYIINFSDLAAEANNAISADGFQRGCKQLVKAGLILTHLKPHGQYIVILDSQKMGWDSYKVYPAYPRYPWIFEIERFKPFKPANDGGESGEDVPAKDHENRVPDATADTVVRENRVPQSENCGPQEINRVPHGKNRVPQDSGHIENQQDTPLGFELGLNKERKRTEYRIPSFENEADIRASKDGSEFDELLRRVKALQAEEQDLSDRLAATIPARSQSAAKKLATHLIKYCTENGGGMFSNPQKGELVTAILENDGYSDNVWQRAVTLMLSHLSGLDDNGFHLGHAGSKIPGSIASFLDNAKKDYAQRALQPLVLGRQTAIERIRVIAEQTELSRQSEESESLIEETLGDSTPPVCTENVQI